MSLSMYYELNGKNLDRYLVDTTSEYISDDGNFKKLTLENVSQIIDYSKENYDEIQKNTLEYILENCRFTVAAKKWMEKKIKEIAQKSIFNFSSEETLIKNKEEEIESFQDALILGEIIGKEVKNKKERNYFIVESIVRKDFNSLIEKILNFLRMNDKLIYYFISIFLTLIFFSYLILSYRSSNLVGAKTPIISSFPTFKVPFHLQKSVSYSYLNFPRNKYYLDSSFIKKLNQLKSILIKNPNMKLEIIGYTSVQGKVERNIQIAQLRATFVYNYFIEYKIPRERLEIKTYVASEREIISSSYDHNYYRRVIFRLKSMELSALNQVREI